MIKDKIVSIQYLRGLAALAVVFCHFGSHLYSYRNLSNILSFGQNGVFVFFLISGFIIVYSLIQSNYKVGQFFNFLLKRSIRIDPAYIVAILLTLALFKVLTYIPSYRGAKFHFIPAQFLANIFYVIPFTKYRFYLNVSWTLCIEFQFYLLIGIGYFLNSNWIYRTIFLILFTLSCLIRFPTIYVVFTYAPIFGLGISLVNYYLEPKWFNLILPFFCLAFVEIKFGIPIFILVLLTSLTILYLKKNIPLLGFLGDISYSLYLIHTLVLLLVSGLNKKLGVDMEHNQLLWLFLQVIFAIVFSYFYYLLIEKPSVNFSKKIFYKK